MVGVLISNATSVYIQKIESFTTFRIIFIKNVHSNKNPNKTTLVRHTHVEHIMKHIHD